MTKWRGLPKLGARVDEGDLSAGGVPLMTRKRFDYADTLALELRAHKLPKFVREFRPLPPRRWRLDLAWPELRFFVECDGGEFQRGLRRHGGAKDCEKWNALTMAGWTGLRFVGTQITSGVAIRTIRERLRVLEAVRATNTNTYESVLLRLHQ